MNNCLVILMTCLTIPLSLGQQVYLLMQATLVYRLIYTLTYVLPSRGVRYCKFWYRSDTE